MKKLLMALLVSFIGMNAYAYDTSIAGKLISFDVTLGTNYGFRVSFEGYPYLCSGNQTWAYLNEAESNYKTYTAALMAAKMTGTPVLIYTDVDANHYCHIVYIRVQ